LIVDQVRLKSLSCHAPSLRQPLRRSTPVDFKRHHYRILCDLVRRCL
jgi:hypothetical protein